MTVPPPGLLLGGWTLSVAPSTAAGVTLAAVCCAAFGLWRVPPPGGRRRRATVAALRLVAVAAVAVLICGPERRVEGDAEPVPFPVLLDVSDSMRTGGNRGAGGEPSRGEDAVAVIRRWGKGRPLHIRPFAATLGPPAPVGTAGMVDLDRTGSDPAAAVRAALTDPAVRRAGLLAIMTDGRSTVGPAGRLSAAAGAARQAGVRLLIVGAGEPDPLGGPRLVTFTAGRPIGAGEPVTVAAAWTFVDGAPLRPPPLVATVVDRSDGTVAAAGPVTIGDDGVARFAAVVTPPAAGRRIYDLTLSAHDAPIAGAGGSAAIDVPGETVRVLLTADRPRHEVRFLQSLLEREPTVRLTAAVGADQRGGGGEPEDADRFDVTVTVGPAGVGPAGVGLAGDGSNPDSASGRINVTASPVEGAATEPAAVVATAGGRGLGLFLTDPPAIYGRLADLPPDPADVPLATAGGIPLVTLRRGAGGAILTVRTAQRGGGGKRTATCRTEACWKGACQKGACRTAATCIGGSGWPRSGWRPRRRTRCPRCGWSPRRSKRAASRRSSRRARPQPPSGWRATIDRGSCRWEQTAPQRSVIFRRVATASCRTGGTEPMETGRRRS